jgi:hypothetical protein
MDWRSAGEMGWRSAGVRAGDLEGRWAVDPEEEGLEIWSGEGGAGDLEE